MREGLSYRPIFNRNRTVIFLHPRPSEIADLIDVFQSQGFITNVALNLGSLGRLVEGKIPDAVLAYAPAGMNQAEITAIKDLVFGARMFLIADEIPPLVEVVRAIRSGALSVFAYPMQVTEVVREIESELANDLRIGDHSVVVAGMNSLTPREREVLELILQGGSNKEAGRLLHISPRTIEVHRAHVMKKLGARNTAEMVKIALGR